ncbi:uncharacterized protein HD556DRAFT_1409820 [Suillus plorans]|uniref:DUF6533 domain-containing protein n=1 Tax=Suillus plorans TaxID=116603 RepID=A0A9P7DBK2_9AGAM|nr:uncharacterized protein HD556DRAFT_1409820 [Suillus plorans]KAG1787373.1 hypothetical protein HD556DRAFT_1409820 [Suillus plorans]
MEYSADDIAAARSLQFTMYIYTSLATFWTYDYVCSIHEEWTYLFQSQWGRMKGMYIVTRYLPFILLATDLYLSFTPDENPGKCRTLDSISTGLGMLLVICSECFFILRTYVLWDNNRLLLVAMLSTFFCFVVASISIAFATTVPAAHTSSQIPGITGCYRSSTNYQLFISFLFLFVFELELMILTFIRAIQTWRTNPNRLYAILVHHNLAYYACGLLFSVANIFTSLLLHDAYQTILDGFQFMILAILATRMHLYLWQVNRQTHGSGDFTHIPMSDLSFVTSTA